MLFVTAAVQREANFGNRLLKHISALKGVINQKLEGQAHPVLWVSLAANSSSQLRRRLPGLVPGATLARSCFR